MTSLTPQIAKFAPAVILDFDGTVIDTESAEYVSWNEIYEEFGLTLPFDRWSEAVGAGDVFDPMAYLQSQLTHPLDREALLERRRARDRELSASLPLRPGIAEIIRSAHEAAIPLALATNSRRRWVLPHLERLGIRGAFTAVVTGDDPVRPKPEPDIYLLAVERVGTRSSRAVAVEDSPNGYTAAARAGVACVAVPNAVTTRMAFPKGAPIEMSVPPLERLLALIGATIPKG